MMILVPDWECKRAPGEDDFYLIWTNFQYFNLTIYELKKDLWMDNYLEFILDRI